MSPSPRAPDELHHHAAALLARFDLQRVILSPNPNQTHVVAPLNVPDDPKFDFHDLEITDSNDVRELWTFWRCLIPNHSSPPEPPAVIRSRADAVAAIKSFLNALKALTPGTNNPPLPNTATNDDSPTPKREAPPGFVLDLEPHGKHKSRSVLLAAAMEKIPDVFSNCDDARLPGERIGGRVVRYYVLMENTKAAGHPEDAIEWAIYEHAKAGRLTAVDGISPGEWSYQLSLPESVRQESIREYTRLNCHLSATPELWRWRDRDESLPDGTPPPPKYIPSEREPRTVQELGEWTVHRACFNRPTKHNLNPPIVPHSDALIWLLAYAENEFGPWAGQVFRSLFTRYVAQSGINPSELDATPIRTIVAHFRPVKMDRPKPPEAGHTKEGALTAAKCSKPKKPKKPEIPPEFQKPMKHWPEFQKYMKAKSKRPTYELFQTWLRENHHLGLDLDGFRMWKNNKYPTLMSRYKTALKAWETHA